MRHTTNPDLCAVTCKPSGARIERAPDGTFPGSSRSSPGMVEEVAPNGAINGTQKHIVSCM